MVRNRILMVLSILLVAGMILAACGPATTPPPAPTAAPTKPGDTPVPPPPTPVPPPPTEVQPKTLIVCQGQEPETMYIYGGAMLASAFIQDALYDGPIDNRSFDYQPVIIEKLPLLADGDAVIQTVQVGIGDKVVDAGGDPVELAAEMSPTARLRPAGCYADDCAVEYAGQDLDMEQMVVTFKLVDGLTWADGTPVKASDSVYSWNLYMDPDTPTPSRYLGLRSTSYEATDDKTVVWTGLPGYRDSTYFTNFFQPLPEHQLGTYTAAELVSAEESSRTPLGYGAFTAVEWIAGDHFTVKKNEHYFRAAEGLPKVDEIIYRFVGEDANTAIASLLAGECDILTQDLSLDSVAELMNELEAKGQMAPHFITGTAWEHVDFGITSVPTYERPDFFGDVRMRRAFGMCLNRQQVVDELLYGRSQAIASYIPPVHPVFNTDLEVLPYDPAAAQAILDELGWTDADGDGIRECNGCNVAGASDGTPLAFRWGSTTAPLRISYMQIFQANLKECGFDVSLDNMPAGQWFASGPDGPLFGRHFDVGSFTWLTGVEPPCGLYLCTQIPSEESGWAGQNDPGYCNPDYDVACNAAIQSLPKTPEYEQNHKEAQRIFAEDLPVIPLYLRLKIAATRVEVTGFIMDPTTNSEMWNVENMDITLP